MRRRAQLPAGAGDAALRDAARAQGVTDDALLDALLRAPRNDSEVVTLGRAATQIGVEELDRRRVARPAMRAGAR